MKKGEWILKLRRMLWSGKRLVPCCYARAGDQPREGVQPVRFEANRLRLPSHAAQPRRICCFSTPPSWIPCVAPVKQGSPSVQGIAAVRNDSETSPFLRMRRSEGSKERLTRIPFPTTGSLELIGRQCLGVVALIHFCHGIS